MLSSRGITFRDSGADGSGVGRAEDDHDRGPGGACGDVSDAGADIVRMQLGQDPGPMAWHRIDAGGTPAEVLARARAALGLPD